MTDLEAYQHIKFFIWNYARSDSNEDKWAYPGKYQVLPAKGSPGIEVFRTYFPELRPHANVLSYFAKGISPKYKHLFDAAVLELDLEAT